MVNRPLDDEFSHITSKSRRWQLRNPDKYREIKRKYQQSDKAKQTRRKWLKGKA